MFEREQEAAPEGEDGKSRGYAEARTAAELNAVFAGNLSGNLDAMRAALGDCAFVSRDNWIRIEGKTPQAYSRASSVISHLFKLHSECGSVRQSDFDTAIRACGSGAEPDFKKFFSGKIRVSSRRHEIVPRTANQLAYVNAVRKSDIVFAVGPAGTGKTYLAVAMAVEALLSGACERIVLARPAVEAGENLGFLPGDLEEKINPYLRPLHDALREMLDPAELESFREKGMIELAPLAFMRGRTLNRSFIILDEAQNTTGDQMLMFLTRLGFHSRCIVSGDPSQTDLPPRVSSGLSDACRRLGNIDGISICRFEKSDVMRHSLVEKIVRAYELSSGSPEEPSGTEEGEK